MENKVQIILKAGSYSSTQLDKLAGVLGAPAAQLDQRLQRGDVVIKKAIDESKAMAMVERFREQCDVTPEVSIVEQAPSPPVTAAAATNSDSPAARKKVETKKSSRRTIGVAAAVVIIAGGIAGGYWTTTPSYSLAQIKKAVDSNDLVKFEKYVDVDSFSESLVDDYFDVHIAGAMAESDDGNSWGQLGAALGAGMANMMKPTITDSMAKGIREWVEQDESASATGQETEVSVKDFGFSSGDATLSSIDFSVERQGSVAYMLVPLERQDIALNDHIKIKLRDMGTYWQVVELSNAKTILQNVKAAEEKRVKEHNADIYRKVNALLDTQTYRKRVTGKTSWGSGMLELEVDLLSKADRPISKIHAILQIEDAESGESLSMERIHYNGSPVEPNGKVTLSDKYPLMFDNVALRKALDSDRKLKVICLIKSITYSTGERLGPVDNYAALTALNLGS